MSASDGEYSEIWNGDLFDRKAEALLLEAYIESVSSSSMVRADARSFTIAVDAPYGVGKSFFLRRLAQHLGRNHPVAFVDAWSDDLADEPLTALAATMQRALDPLIRQSTPVRKQWDNVIEKTGKVAKIATIGLIKRGIGLAITAGAVEAADQVITGVTDHVSDAVQDSLKSTGPDLVSGAQAAFNSVAPHRLMEDRIANFLAGQQAITEMKESLTALVRTLDKQTMFPPIIVVIDELDRCRPTYAVKLLEETKHLFDVPGLVFIFGLNGNQLAGSLSAAYGSKFDGSAYLRRFINRRYTLTVPDLTPLVAQLLDRSGIDPKRLKFPAIRLANNQTTRDPSQTMALILKAYDVSARDVFGVMDALQTCAALTGNTPLVMGYLLPLIISRMQGHPPSFLTDVIRTPSWNFVTDERRNHDRTIALSTLAAELKSAAQLSAHELGQRINRDEADHVSMMILEITMNNQTATNQLANPRHYPELLETVGRFSNPQLDTARP